MVTNSSSNIKTAATGKVLQGQGVGIANDFSTATFPSVATGTGKILIADGTNWVASTPTYPNTSGTAGKVLISDGTNNVYSTPTFPNASATTRKIIVSDGTNWVASTETWAVPGTSGNILTSNGTNWTSGSPLVIRSASLTLTSAQIKALKATPIQILAAQGAGVVAWIYNAMTKLTYGGSNVFIGANALNITAGSGGANICLLSSVGTLVLASATSYGQGNISATTTITSAASYENTALFVANTGATEYTGNAANDNTLTIVIQYSLLTI